MRLSHCGSLNSTLNINACNNYIWNGQTYTITGIYTQSYLNTNGCDSISQLNLVLQNANIGVNQVGNLLTANASSASYQWIDCNSNTIIPGATNQSFNASSPGNYAVIITQACTDTSNCLLVAPLNMNNPINSNSIILYPNPITNELILTSDKLMKQTTIRIKNFVGKTMLLKNDIHGNHFRCDISNFAIGVYFLELIENESIQKIKFLKE